MNPETNVANATTQPVVPMTTKVNFFATKAGLAIILVTAVLLSLAAGIGGTAYYYSQKDKSKETNNTQTTPTPTPTTTVTSTPTTTATTTPTLTVVPTAIKKTYTDTKGMFTFDYSDTYTVTVTSAFNLNGNPVERVRIAKSATSYLDLDLQTAGFGCTSEQVIPKVTVSKIFTGKLSGYLARYKVPTGNLSYSGKTVYTAYSSNTNGQGTVGACGVPLFGLVTGGYATLDQNPGYFYSNLVAPESDYEGYDAIIATFNRL